MLAAAANGVRAITSTSGGLGSPMNSPFSSAPGTCCPFAFLTNFNVQLSGTNIYQSNLNYTFETFLQNFRGGNSLNGGISNEMSSGLIDKIDMNLVMESYMLTYRLNHLKPLITCPDQFKFWGPITVLFLWICFVFWPMRRK